MITSAALANFQNMVAAQFDKAGVIYRPDRTVDGMGHLAPNWVAQNGGAAIPCSLGRMQGANASEEGREVGSLEAWNLCMPVGTDLRQGDRVLVPLANETITVHIQNVDGPQFLPVVLSARATEVQWALEDDPNG